MLKRRDVLIFFTTLNETYAAEESDQIASSLQIASSSALETCNYPSNIWKKTLNELDCTEEYKLDLAWSSHDLCGFAIDNDPNLSITMSHYLTELSITVVDVVKASGKLARRASTYTQPIRVS